MPGTTLAKAVFEYGGITVEVEKPPIPAIWLDSFAFIKSAKLNLGEDLPDVDRCRMVRLLALVEDKVRDNRLLCVQGEQEEEIDCGQTAGLEARRILAQSAPRYRLKHRYEVEAEQIYRLSGAFLKGQNCVTLPWSDAFCATWTNHVVPVEVEVRTHAARAKLCSDLEQVRRAIVGRVISFERQKEVELCHLLPLREEIQQRLDALTPGEAPSQRDRALCDYLARLVAAWERAGGHRSLFNQFLGSAHGKATPIGQIYSTLYADLLTGARVEQGDAYDLHHISTALPYCHYILVDDRSLRRIIRRGLDKTCHILVFSERTIEGLFSALLNL